MNKPKMIQLLTILVVESFFTLHEYLLKSLLHNAIVMKHGFQFIFNLIKINTSCLTC